MNYSLNDSNNQSRTDFRKSLRFLPLAVAALLCLALVGCGAAAPDPAAGNGGGGGGKGGRGGRGGGKGKQGGPVPVVTAAVATKNVPIELQVVGNVEALSTVSVRAQVTGQLINVAVRDGDYVKKGQQLFQIDPSVIQGQLAQAQANLARSTAQLAQAEANLGRDSMQEKFQKDLADRYAKLVAEGVISKDSGQQQRTSADVLGQAIEADRAAIASAKAQIQADTAAVNNINLQLGFTNVKAPIDGRAGSVTTKQGNLVTQNNTELMQILQVEPIYVTFAVPEAKLSDVKRYMGNSTLPVSAKPQDGSGESESGRLTFIDNAVDITTGTIRLKAEFKNTDHKLWPGQFVNVTLRLTTRQNAVVVPNQAVQTGQDGTFVYVVKADRTVEVRPVTTGPRVDQDLVVEKGLEMGETVVTEGQLRLQPGSQITTRDGAGGRGGRGGDAKGGGGKGGDAKGGDAATGDAAAPTGGGGEGRGKGGRAGKGDGAPTGAPGEGGGDSNGGGRGKRKKSS